MLDYAPAEAWSSDALWSWFSAQRAVLDAIVALEDAGAALLPLIDTTRWHAQGVMALHELIIETRARTASELGELHTRAWEISSLAGS